jgi:hypothetical protein
MLLSKEHLPPNSPDLNPLDFYFWNAVVRNMHPLKKFVEFKDEIRRAVCEV